MVINLIKLWSTRRYSEYDAPWVRLTSQWKEEVERKPYGSVSLYNDSGKSRNITLDTLCLNILNKTMKTQNHSPPDGFISELYF